MPMITFFNKDNQPAYAMCDCGLILFDKYMKDGKAYSEKINSLINCPVNIDGVDRKLTCGTNQFKLLQRMIGFVETTFDAASKEGFEFNNPFKFFKIESK